MTSSEIKELAELLHQLREADKDFRVFGADSHKYQLRPKLSEAKLIEFENAHRIKLPEDYRMFLREIGDGRAGPYYGLATLEVAAQYRDLSRSFPFTTATDFYSDEELIAKFGQREEDPGILEICHQGCAIYSYLVVNGPTYGTIWDGREDVYPSNLSFGVWYRRWAEKTLRILKNEPLIDKLVLGMTKEQVIAATGGDWKERNPYSDLYLFEASEISAQIVLSGKDGVVKEIRRWPFISARP